MAQKAQRENKVEQALRKDLVNTIKQRDSARVNVEQLTLEAEGMLGVSHEERTLILSLRENAHAKVKTGAPIHGEDGLVYLTMPQDEDGEELKLPKGGTLADRPQVAAYMYHCDTLKKLLETHMVTIKSNLDAASIQLGSMMENVDLEKFTQVMGDQMSVNFKMAEEEYVSIKKEVGNDAFLFLLANGMGSIIKETVHHKSLSSQVKAWVEANLNVDDDADDDTGNVPEIDTAETVEETAEYMEQLGVQAEEIIREKIDYWLQMMTDLRGAKRDSLELDECFNRHTVLRGKITYRKRVD